MLFAYMQLHCCSLPEAQERSDLDIMLIFQGIQAC